MAASVTGLSSPASWSLVRDKFSKTGLDTLGKVVDFVQSEIVPAEEVYATQLAASPLRFSRVPPIINILKEEAKKRGLWNLFLPKELGGTLSCVEYAVIAEIQGRCIHLAPQAMNCSAPDTGNMEILAKYGSTSQKVTYLTPLLNGEIRSAFAMTEKGVASSDALNIQNTTIRREGDSYILNGRKWWISGAGDPRCKVHLVLGKQDDLKGKSPHQQHTILVVPPDAPGVKIVRPMMVMGYDDAPEGHMEVVYTNVQVPLSALLGSEGEGFAIIQSRLGPGRIHHCMRSIGQASRALDLMVLRITDPQRLIKGRQIWELGSMLEKVAELRAKIEGGRLLVLAAAQMIDEVGPKAAMKEIGIAKLVVPKMALEVVDTVMQAFGAEGLSQDQPLAATFAGLRTLRFADGPDETHANQIGRLELKRAPLLRAQRKLVEEKTEKLLAQVSRAKL